MKYSFEFVKFIDENFDSKEISCPTIQVKSKTIPVIEVKTAQALNKIIAKWREHQKTKTFFRGQKKFHQQIPISGKLRVEESTDDIYNLIDCEKTLEVLLSAPPIKILSRGLSRIDFWDKIDELTLSDKQIDGLGGDTIYENQIVPAYAVEGLLQQYIGGTRWVDVVDNVQIALWMATRDYKQKELTRADSQSCYKPIEVTQARYDDNTFVYLYLYSFKSISNDFTGLYKSKDSLLLDLREALPSRYLRPHSQHAMLIRDYCENLEIENGQSTNVVALQINTKLAIEAIGDSSLLKNETIFPEDSDDPGFNSISSFIRIYGKQAQEIAASRIREENYIPRYF